MYREKIKELMYHYLTTEPEGIKRSSDCYTEITEMVDGIIDCAVSEAKAEILREINRGRDI